MTPALLSNVILFADSDPPYPIQAVKGDGSGLTTVVAPVGLPYQWFFAAASPVSGKIVAGAIPLALGVNNLYVMDSDGSNRVKITNIDAATGYPDMNLTTHPPTWSPGGDKFVVPFAGGGGLCIVNADNSGHTSVALPTMDLSNDNDVVYWSPAGDKFAFPHSSAPNFRGGVSICNTDGSGVTAVLNEDASSFYVLFGWYRDNTSLLVQKVGQSSPFPVQVMKTPSAVLYDDPTQAVFTDGYPLALSLETDDVVFIDEVGGSPTFGGLRLLSSGGVVSSPFAVPPHPTFKAMQWVPIALVPTVSAGSAQTGIVGS